MAGIEMADVTVRRTTHIGTTSRANRGAATNGKPQNCWETAALSATITEETG